MLRENINEIKYVIELLAEEIDKTTNNASMSRCRKRTLHLAKLFKDYRKLSVAESKKK
jgi:hypothetical protein